MDEEGVGFHLNRHTLHSGLNNGKSDLESSPAQYPIYCPECGSERVCKDSLRKTVTGVIQGWLCRECGLRFSESNLKFPVKVDKSFMTLERELESLKQSLKTGYELSLVWSPNKSTHLSGEVKEETVFIYEEEYDKALDTLRHEFLDYAISKIIDPYKEVTNLLIGHINKDAYTKKEKLVESLCQLIKDVM